MEPPSPSDLLSRSLVTADRDAVRLSAEAMARNTLQSFEKALEWRAESWLNTLTDTLVRKERELASQGATIEQIRELMRTREAIVIASIRKATEEIQPIDVHTYFQVLPQRIGTDVSKEEPATRLSSEAQTKTPSSASDSASAPVTRPLKKRRMSKGSSKPKGKSKAKAKSMVPSTPIAEKTSGPGAVTHGLLFVATLGFMTPSGYAEVSLEAPGKIVGTFVRCEVTGNNRLRGVDIQVDTEILAAMIEKSSRIIIRSSTTALITPAMKAVAEADAKAAASSLDKEQSSEAKSNPTTEAVDATTDSAAAAATTTERMAKHLSTPQPAKTKDLPLPSRKLAIISPRESPPASDDNESELEMVVEQSRCIPIPHNFSTKEHKRAALRMVSPQPRSPMTFIPATPTKKSKLAPVPCLVSPPLSMNDDGSGSNGGNTTEYLTFDASGPKLPALVEVARAAMETC